MVWVCGKEYKLGEYLWGIEPSVPHEHGEPQMGVVEVEKPCNCTPVQITDEGYDRRRQAVLDENLQYL